MMMTSQRAHRTHSPKQSHPGRNKSKAAALANSRAPPNAGALDHAVSVIYRVCCLAGAADLLDDVRAELRSEGIPKAIRRHDTAILFDWLMAALSYQGISDRVAFDYMERHGRAQWADIKAKLGNSAPCPKLTSYWHYH